MITIEKNCPECGTSIRGRADKKFCSDQCRSTYFHRVRPEEYAYVKRINAILRKNWRILCEFPVTDKKPIHATELKLRGFDLGYFTSCEIDKDGLRWYYCYNKAYIELEGNFYMVVR